MIRSRFIKKESYGCRLIEEEEEFTPNHLIELEKQYKPARIISSITVCGIVRT